MGPVLSGIGALPLVKTAVCAADEPNLSKGPVSGKIRRGMCDNRRDVIG
tara:strand:- start:426 stop:572 length:147 start_codon:yes stop_codon:yes gene_type:complete